MKKYLIVLLAVALSSASTSCGSNTKKKQEPAPVQQAQIETKKTGATPSSLNDLLQNYTGTFSGVIPCADCSGIDTKLTLNNNYTYSLSTIYQGKDHPAQISTGSWQVNDALNVITLVFENPNEFTYYKIVNVNTLQMLDTEGKPINSAHSYSLTR